MTKPVFISYARRTSRGPAVALHAALGGDDGLAFLDSSDIEAGERFPKVLAEALLGARVVVALADAEYFRRWYCLRELRTALGPFDAALRRAPDDASPAGRADEALVTLVVALPADGSRPTDVERLPAGVRTRSWPRADETEALAALVRQQLERAKHTIAARLGSDERARELRTAFEAGAALPPPRPLAGVPMFPIEVPKSLHERFVGRADDLWRLHFHLATLRGDPAAAAALSSWLEGGGGFGKTQLAAEYLHRYGPAYHPGGLFWVNAEASEAALEQQHFDILRVLRPETPELRRLYERGTTARAELARALHALPPEQPVLFVVDNVPETPPRRLDTWCPARDRVTVLATSRRHLIREAGVEPFDVAELAPAAAVALLRGGLPEAKRRVLADDAWERIAAWVGGLPLALELLNASLLAGSLLPRELLARADSRDPAAELDTQLERLRGLVPDGVLRGVTQAFALSWECLSPMAQRLARLLAQLAPEPIPLELFDALGDPNDPSHADARAELLTRSWVIPVEEEAVPMLGRVHRVLAGFVRGRSSTQGDDDASDAAAALVSVMAADRCRTPQEWPSLSASAPHAEHLFAHLTKAPGARPRARESADADSSGASGPATRDRPSTVAGVGLRLGVLYGAQGLFSRARPVEEAVVRWSKATLGNEHPNTLTSMNNLAETLRALGDSAGARALHEQALGVYRRTLGDEHPDTLSSMNNLALTLMALGDSAGARALHEHVLGARRRTLGDEHPNTLRSMSNLAATLRALGDSAGARALHKQALDARRRTLGDEHPDTLSSMNNLALTLGALGDSAGERALHEQAFSVYRRTLGPRHPATTVSAWNLLLTLNELDLPADAQRILDEALAWLLDAPEESLGADQRRVQFHLRNYVAARNPTR